MRRRAGQTPGRSAPGAFLPYFGRSICLCALPRGRFVYLFIDISILARGSARRLRKERQNGKIHLYPHRMWRGVVIIEPTVFGDERGYFMETYSERNLPLRVYAAPLCRTINPKSTRGAARAALSKAPPQGKLVRVVSGEVFDVAVDCRPHSPTFGKWAGVHLSAANKRQFTFPRGSRTAFLC